MRQLRNLVFEGGGVKGIAYCGALDALEKKGMFDGVQRVVGTSAGAIIAALVGLRYTPKECLEVLWDTDFQSFMDDDFGKVRDAHRLVNDFGWYKGEKFKQWMGDLILDKADDRDVTFKELEAMAFRDTYIIGADLSTHTSVRFSAEHTPDAKLVDAVRISMSIPFFFAAVRGEDGHVYVDGGALNNYAIEIFDHTKYISETTSDDKERVINEQTLGFRLDSETEIAMFRDREPPPTHDINDFFDYVWHLMQTACINIQNNRHLRGEDWKRTVYIDTLGVKATDFGLDDKTKQSLVDSGHNAVNDFFEKRS
ncbi:MAG: patatin-like phospholipase family protein [Acidiferrobacterales bacterium]